VYIRSAFIARYEVGVRKVDTTPEPKPQWLPLSTSTPLSGYTNGDWLGAMMRWIEQPFDDRDDVMAVMFLSVSADMIP
jgi:hypothetical protein